MNLRFLDCIWHVRGSLALASEQTNADVFDKLDPLFRQFGTRHERTHDTLTFRKKDAAAQDKMAVFDDGTLTIENHGSGSTLRYYLTSKILLLCFLAPFLFLAVAELTIYVARLEKPTIESAENSGKTAAKDAKLKKKSVVVPMSPIDKALGAPAPEDPNKKGADKGDEDKKLKPTAAYVLAAIFTVLYMVGRVLEDRLVRNLFRKRLAIA